MRLIYRLTAWAFILGNCGGVGVCTAQPGTVDPSFLPVDVTTGQLSGFNGLVQAAVAAPDGKVLVGGNFTQCNGLVRNGLARLNADGTLDTGFDPGFGPNGMVWCMALQPDGRVLVGGAFTYVNGTPARRLVRLNTDGSVDTGFSVASGFNHDVFCVAVQADGRVLAGGDFNQFVGAPHARLVRLLADGTLDPSFDPGTCLGGSVNALAVQDDGRILIGGNFSELQGQPVSAVARLLHDGALDPSFAPPAWPASLVSALALHADGAITVAGLIPHGVARLQPDGQADPAFSISGSGFGGWAPQVNGLIALPSGGILLAGRFTAYDGVPCGNLVQLDALGQVDPSFNAGSGADQEVFALAATADGQAIMGGLFDHVNGQPRPHIARLQLLELSTGTPEAAPPELRAWPNPTDGEVYVEWNGAPPARAELLAPDGRFIQHVTLGATAARMDLGVLPTGTYLLRYPEKGNYRTVRLQRR